MAQLLNSLGSPPSAHRVQNPRLIRETGERERIRIFIHKPIRKQTENVNSQARQQQNDWAAGQTRQTENILGDVL